MQFLILIFSKTLTFDFPISKIRFDPPILQSLGFFLYPTTFYDLAVT